MLRESASLDGNVFHFGDHADARPAFGLHFVEISHTGEISHGICSSRLSSLLTDRIGAFEVINAGNLHGYSTFLGGGEVNEKGNECNENDFHFWKVIDYTTHNGT